jgi:hypothetical protein
MIITITDYVTKYFMQFFVVFGLIFLTLKHILLINSSEKYNVNNTNK